MRILRYFIHIVVGLWERKLEEIMSPLNTEINFRLIYLGPIEGCMSQILKICNWKNNHRRRNNNREYMGRYEINRTTKPYLLTFLDSVASLQIWRKPYTNIYFLLAVLNSYLLNGNITILLEQRHKTKHSYIELLLLIN